MKHWEKAEFPYHAIPKLASLKVAGGTIKGYGCPGLSLTGSAIAIAEVARVDASCSTFILVHSSLAMLTIGLCGSEEQKQKYLLSLAQLQTVACWGLTEPDYGSDASSLRTTTTKVSGGWILDGQKRWIGNNTFADVLVIFARNMEINQINGNNAMGIWAKIKGTTGEFRNPNSVGQAIVKNLSPSEMIESTSVAGPGFVNIGLSNKWIAQSIHNMLSNGIGTWAPLLPVSRALVDFSSPNIANEMHVGHLRYRLNVEKADWVIYLTNVGQSLHFSMVFSGNTVVYLLYAHTRICSIIRKSGEDIEDLKRTRTIVLGHADERILSLHLIRFVEIVEEACTNLLPNVLCKYLYDLSDQFSGFYTSCQVVRSPEETSSCYYVRQLLWL
ncbi:hypothetical protein J5N97_013740 [Dioscorea zingiberensis]|uniref:arginine--tRNA ligase n=1 Tax=Dioscorea zingiberensis TaxID=325984 RepID=A0A9D5CRD4_9LILI|nr:hypothetical protein J5N97_013740 [Dioscorea zingiberensis]